jgi:hypothetical protein
VLDEEIKKVKLFIQAESEARQEFHKNVHTYLPSSFLPGLRDGAPELSLEGPSSEFDFPRIEDDSIELKALPNRQPGR